MIFTINSESPTAVYLQLHDQVVLAIAKGEVSVGEQLPTIRALSDELGINMMTVSKCYQLLSQEGYIVTDRRSGALISDYEGKGVTRSRMDAMQLHLAELRLCGMEKSEILLLCRQMLETLK